MTSPASQFWLRKRPNSYRSNFKVTFVDPYYQLENCEQHVKVACPAGKSTLYLPLATGWDLSFGP